MDDSFSSSDFETAASATASPETALVETGTLASDPALVSAEAVPDPAATVPATDTPIVPVVSEKKGPIPFDVHHTALANARAAVAKEWEPYAWAKDVPQASLSRMSNIAERMSSDPLGFLSTYYEELQNHPTHGPAVRSWAAKTLGSKPGKAPDLTPDLDITDANGQVVSQTFSAARVQQIVQHAVSEAISKEVAPLKQDQQQRQASEHAATEAQRVKTATDESIAFITDLVGNDDAHLTAVGEALAANPSWSAERAAAHVLKTVIMPGLSKTERVSVLADIAKKPAASTVSPGRSTTAVPTRDADKSWEQLFEERSAALSR